MAADRAEHVGCVLEPALAAGEWVVTDRYAASTIAYQGYGQGLDPAALDRLVQWATGGLAADVSVLVDVSVEVAAGRLAAAGRGASDRLERLGPAFAGRVRGGSWPRRWRIPHTGSWSTARRRSARSTAHIVACVRDRLGAAPAPGR